MKKHLRWPEDDRVCKLPDSSDACPGCCNMVNPKYPNGVWTCIWKSGHSDLHCDIFCDEWSDSGNHHSSTDRCKYCGDPVPDDGMTYCGKACAALNG